MLLGSNRVVASIFCTVQGVAFRPRHAAMPLASRIFVTWMATTAAVSPTGTAGLLADVGFRPGYASDMTAPGGRARRPRRAARYRDAALRLFGHGSSGQLRGRNLTDGSRVAGAGRSLIEGPIVLVARRWAAGLLSTLLCGCATGSRRWSGSRRLRISPTGASPTPQGQASSEWQNRAAEPVRRRAAAHHLTFWRRASLAAAGPPIAVDCPVSAGPRRC